MGSGGLGPESLIGRQIGGYRLEQLLGTGATGAVFLGQRLTETSAELSEQAAIKVLILPWQMTPDERTAFRARFVREAEVLERLRHPHLLSVLAVGEDAGTDLPYMVLPYMRGGTLAARLMQRASPFPLTEVAELLRQLADALDYAHNQGVVHRDLKPGNILLDDAGQTHIADFSIARLLSETQTNLTTTGRVMGTPAYMAPEQFTSSKVDPPADIYSLGMVVYQLVTGAVAFPSDSLPQVMRAQLQETPSPPRQRRPDLPEPAEAAILRALEKEPNRRFASAGALARAFAAGLAGRWTEGLAPEVRGMAGANATLPQFVPAGTLQQPTPPGMAPQYAPPAPAPQYMSPSRGPYYAPPIPAQRPQPLGRRGMRWPVLAAAVLLLAVLSSVAFALNGGQLPFVPQSSGSGPTATTSSGPTSTPPATFTPPKRIKVGLVTDLGGLNDNGLNQLANAGLGRAKSQLGIQGDVKVSQSANDYVPNLTSFASQGYDLVIGIGFLMQQAVGTVSGNFPTIHFAIVDGVGSDATFNDLHHANVESLFFKEQEEGALVGVIAGMLEKTGQTPKHTNTISTVGGISIPPVNRYIAGFQWGARLEVPSIKLLNGYSNNFTDPSPCQNVANSQIAAGSEIVFQVAGGCGLGVFQAASQNQVYSIGVDLDQKSVDPSVIASAVQRVDNAVFLAIQDVVNGSFRSGEVLSGLANDGVGYAQGNITLSQNIVDEVTRVASQIKSGALTVSDTITQSSTPTPTSTPS